MAINRSGADRHIAVLTLPGEYAHADTLTNLGRPTVSASGMADATSLKVVDEDAAELAHSSACSGDERAEISGRRSLPSRGAPDGQLALYPSLIGPGQAAQADAAYGPNADRLRSIKAAFDHPQPFPPHHFPVRAGTERRRLRTLSAVGGGPLPFAHCAAVGPAFRPDEACRNKPRHWFDRRHH
jgi:hypothetical protein